MSKSMSMLRTRRRDNNVKPNRRLDRKSSRGMIYENEELRLKTININAEIERGQSDIKKLRRENEMLKKEIWCLRDEYEKLDKLLKDKDVDFSSSTCTSDSESCSSCTDESGAVESTQNLENVQKTNLKNLHVEFDHLSVVPEENSPEGSDKCTDVIKPDQSYPQPVHFFSPLPQREPYQEFLATFQNFHQEAVPLQKTSSDIIVKLDNQSFNGTGSFSNGGNLEELLNDIETISRDILEMSNEKLPTEAPPKVPYKSELNVVLMPSPMPLIGFEKYEQFKTSHEDFLELPVPVETLEVPKPEDFLKPKNEELCTSRSNLLELTSSDHVSSENEENLRFNGEKKPAKMSIRRKVSIHFKGKKEKAKEEEKTHKKTPSLDSKKSAEELTKKQNSSTEPKSSGSERNSLMEKKARKSVSISPDRKHHDKKHKKHKKTRRSTISNEHVARERSFSVCTDRSAFHPPFGEEPQSTDRERTNSLSSCNSVRMREMSNFSNAPVSGKIPWCGCWGNGCI